MIPFPSPIFLPQQPFFTIISLPTRTCQLHHRHQNIIQDSTLLAMVASAPKGHDFGLKQPQDSYKASLMGSFWWNLFFLLGFSLFMLGVELYEVSSFFKGLEVWRELDDNSTAHRAHEREEL